MIRSFSYSGFELGHTGGWSGNERRLDDVAALLLQVNALMRGRMLLPNLRFFRAAGAWLMSSSGPPVLSALLSPHIEQSEIIFVGNTDTLMQIPNSLTSLSLLAPNLTFLRICFVLKYGNTEVTKTLGRVKVRDLCAQLSPI